MLNKGGVGSIFPSLPNGPTEAQETAVPLDNNLCILSVANPEGSGNSAGAVEE